MPVNKSIEEIALEVYPIKRGTMWSGFDLNRDKRKAYIQCYKDLCLPLKEALEEIASYENNSYDKSIPQWQIAKAALSKQPTIK